MNTNLKTQVKKPQDIFGINPIAAMPFTAEGNVDLNSFKTMLEHLITTGCYGVTLFGIASEFYKLNDAEKAQLTDIFISTLADKNMYRCISVTEHSTELAVKQAKIYQEAGADCLMLLPPFFLKPDNAQVKEHICAVLQAVDVPVLVQYAPTETGVPIPAEQLAEISKEFPNAVFKIECNPPVEYIQALLTLLPDAVILNGYAGLYMTDVLSVGGKGVMPGCSFTEVYMSIYKLWIAGDHEAANSLHQRLLEYIRPWMESCEYIIQVEKTILHKRGIITDDYCRKPNFALSQDDESIINEFLKDFDNILKGA
ncbi:dihydrodipicolinate synthase family protein [Pseudocolwellia agarivorans]|uniref:dihydrodipicolinate synthase family protein n=1 Tax=Pseudocolwellia agarivorans TaxID=1911682 RepID=UPI000984AAC1|nr:dihydrodipicolinate synthase family protein [Pseudocolwellia agarivorans]